MSPPAAKRRRISYQQLLGLPEPILYYIKKKANPKLQLKLMQTTKYFCFKEFPYMVVKELKYDHNKWLYCKGKYSWNYTRLDLETLSKPLWITKGLNCYTEDEGLVSRLLSKAVVCDVKNLRLEDQIITWNELKLLISSGNIENLTFCYSHVEYENNKIVGIDEILQLLPNVKQIRWLLDPETASIFTSETTQKLINSLNPLTLQSFCIMNIPESFDFNYFAEFMNANPLIDCYLDFDVLISNEYSAILQTYVNNVIETASTKYYPLHIRFPRQTETSIKCLQNLYKLYNQGDMKH
uniref:Uncharacterized protein n=1 Tax=Panagrolaimus superbus TaxID=310955 RepID=A0A914YUL4_9BILA